jgi:hypothetical protein
MKQNKLQKLLTVMGDKVLSYTELYHKFIEYIDSGTQYSGNPSKRFSELLKRGMTRGFILRVERGMYVVSKKGHKYKW